MSIRLITTHEEAKALKEAGWPQELDQGDHFCFAGGGLPTEPQMYTEDGMADEDEGIASSLEIMEGLASRHGISWLRCPRLDELLAFLIERTARVQCAFYQTSVVRADFGTAKVEELANEPIAAAVASVLHVLNSERPAPTEATA